jgi:hypothetical protein
MNIDAPNTGVTTANILIVSNRLIVTKGNIVLLLVNPGMDKVLLVISRLVNDIVVLIPANIVATISKSWLP